MLEPEIQHQLETVFKSLEHEVALVVYASDHPKQAELFEWLQAVAATSHKLSVVPLAETSEVPQFRIHHQNKFSGISFVGIPGGHEFTSLVLAILNSDQKGKLPDEGIIQRIKNLKGPIRLRTFVSLSCENCPEVVQALNLMATLHDEFEHTMIDGEFKQDEITSLNLMGVPSVMNGTKLISSGKTSLMELLQKLEKEFGTQEKNVTNKKLGMFDVAVIGGGPAGASAAVYSARKGLKVAVITDRLGGQLQDTKGIENFISTTYTEGARLSADLNKHMAEYGVNIFEHRKVAAIENEKLKKITLDTGETLEAKSIIVTTGAKWRRLGVPGESNYIGRGVAFCPHCDGPFYKGKDVAVVGGGNSGVEAAIDLSNIVKSVTLLEFLPELKADQVLVDKLKSLPNVRILKNAKTLEVVGNGEKVVALDYEDRATQKKERITLDGVFVQIGLVPNSEFVKGLVATNPYGEIIVDHKCKTNVPGIYAAGDVTTVPFKQIIISMGEGAKAALTAYEETMK